MRLLYIELLHLLTSESFGCRPMATVGHAPGPESLQGKNPREVGSDGAASAMGILASAVACTMQAEIGERSNVAS